MLADGVEKDTDTIAIIHNPAIILAKHAATVVLKIPTCSASAPEKRPATNSLIAVRVR